MHNLTRMSSGHPLYIQENQRNNKLSNTKSTTAGVVNPEGAVFLHLDRSGGEKRPFCANHLFLIGYGVVIGDVDPMKAIRCLLCLRIIPIQPAA